MAAASWVLVALATAHTSRLPGRFSRDRPSTSTKSAVADSCETTFTLGGKRFNVTDLQVDVGGYIANNAVDGYSYCVNVCKVVTSERNCVCNACGGASYPAAQIKDEGGSSGQTCIAYLGTLEKATWSTLPAGGLVLTYAGGEGGDVAVINMPCTPHDDGINGPTFVGTRNGVFTFAWNTSYACGTSVAAKNY